MSTEHKLASVPAYAAAVVLSVYAVVGFVLAIQHDGWTDGDGARIGHLRTVISLGGGAFFAAAAGVLMWAARRVGRSVCALGVCFLTALLLFVAGVWIVFTFLLAWRYVVPGQLPIFVPATLALLGLGGVGLRGSIPLLRQQSRERRRTDIAQTRR